MRRLIALVFLGAMLCGLVPAQATPLTCAGTRQQPAGKLAFEQFLSSSRLAFVYSTNDRSDWQLRTLTATGQSDWSFAFDAAALVALQGHPGGKGEPGTVTTVLQPNVSGCSHVVLSRRRDTDGRLLLDRDLGSVEQPHESDVNVVQVAAEDVNADGVADLLLEGRATSSGATGQAMHEARNFRDITPGTPKRAFTWLVDGRSGRVLFTRTAPSRLGVGVMSGVWRTHGTPMVATLENSPSTSGTEAKAVFSTLAGKQRWSTTTSVLPAPLDYVPLSIGAAFLTGQVLTVPTTPSTGVAYQSMRLTALDAASGKVAWSRDWQVAGSSLTALPLGGDVVIDDQRTGTMSRLDGRTSKVIWQTPYIKGQLADTYPLADLTGDGVADAPIIDTPVPMVVDGRNGDSTARPELAVGGRAVVTVPDLDGDGTQDLIQSIGAAEAVVVPLATTTSVVLYSGRTGKEIWRHNLPSDLGQPEIVAQNTGPTALRRVGLYFVDQQVQMLSGKDGTLMWSRRISR